MMTSLGKEPQILPPILALKATPTPHTVLFAFAATSPAHRVPCLKQEINLRYI